MKRMKSRRRVVQAEGGLGMGTKAGVVWGLLAAAGSGAAAQEKLHYTYLWHLEQPIYWPERQPTGVDRYETAWTSIQRKDAGAVHPENNLRDIFGLDDRKAVYQWRVRDSINSIRWTPEGGAQVSYSGGLIENVNSLGFAGQLGYSGNWANSYREARNWFTSRPSNNVPRLDVVLFSFHHGLLPLLDDEVVRKEIQLYKRIYPETWGTSPGMSRGFFPSEMAFSMRLIPILASEGVAWSVVSAEKISRACPDFPVVLGSGGINTDPPNRADQLNPNGVNWYRSSISRGCSPVEAVPFSYTPRRARYVNPSTGGSSEIIVVPAPQSISWRDGYAPLGLSDFNTVQGMSGNPTRPMLLVLTHDGDNAWGGGFSYYLEATPNLASQATGAGYVPTMVERYLADHPVPAGDYVHVEQGAWVNADGDFGSPQFLNWNWPPVDRQGRVDIENGWAEDIRNWAVITAATNRVLTAEQIGGAPNMGKVLSPDSSTSNVERAWHYFLGSLNSGYMYYGTSIDMEVKPTVACNRAMQYADPVIGTGAGDATAPTIWEPQRHPWNPGSLNFGPQYGYRQFQSNGDFYVWSFVYDVSGLSSVVLKYRVDNDGVNSSSTTHNETYAGGSDVGPWQSIAMNGRDFPAGNFFNDPSINFFVMPTYIARQYSAQIVGIRDKHVDYYIEATDTKGHVKRSPIQSVYVGSGTGGGTPGGGGEGGGGTAVVVSPNPPVAGQNVTITYDPAGRPLQGASQVRLHYGFNDWSTIVGPDPAMTLAAGKWTITVPVASSATKLDVVFNNGAGTWDNNGGADWHFDVTGGVAPPSFVMDGVRDTRSVLVASNNGLNLWASLIGDVLYVATNDAGEGNDHFIYVARDANALRAANWAKAGQIAGWDAFLADENTNDFEGWFDANPGVAVQAATGANGGVLEGTINLRQEFGTLPRYLRLAVGVYGNADGGALLSASQVPTAVVANGNIEANEYLVLDLCTLDASLCPPPPPPPCPCSADYDGSGSEIPDLDDIVAFFRDFNEGDATTSDGDPSADMDCTGAGSIPDVEDVIRFFEVFTGGC